MDSGELPYIAAPSLYHTSPPLSISPSSSMNLKRRAQSPLEEPSDEGSRKRLKEDIRDQQNKQGLPQASWLIEAIEEELQCGCCSALVYKPVLVMPCQHFFCGSCCVLWIRNNGTNCPSCRSVSTIVTPFRALQGTIDAFLRAAPHKARSERECQQADEIYSGSNLRLPAPREPSPEPNILPDTEFFQPCPHCSRGNPFGWVCPQPIPDPHLDPDHALPLDDGLPPGHGYCGNCEIMLALQAPSTTKCDMCLVSFCGIHVQGRCAAVPLLAQQPHDLGKLDDLIESPRFFECFDENTVEVNYLIDYMTVQSLTPKHIYHEACTKLIATYLQSQPTGFRQLSEAFGTLHRIATFRGPNSGSRTLICRLCAAEVFFWGLRDWWIRERQKGFLEPDITSRPDCPGGDVCVHQKDPGHAREYNHIIAPAAADSTINTLPQPPPPSASSVIPETANLPFMMDVHDDPRMSSPTTPNFRDAADDFL